MFAIIRIADRIGFYFFMIGVYEERPCVSIEFEDGWTDIEIFMFIYSDGGPFGLGDFHQCTRKPGCVHSFYVVIY